MANSTSTLGVEYASKIINIDNKKIRVQICETAGQERFKSITNSYYKNAEGALVVYDITKKSSFDLVDKCMQEFRNIAGDDTFIIIVGNKADLRNIRIVTTEECDAKANKLGKLDFIETSALNNTNIYEAFYNITESKLHLCRDI